MKGTKMPPPFNAPTVQRPLAPLDLVGMSLILLSGLLTLFPSFLDFHHELIPLVLGVSCLLIAHSKEAPIRVIYLWLFLLAMRIYLHSDERYFGWEIVLADYLMIVVAFAATYRLRIRFWAWFLTLYALVLPLGGMISLSLYLFNQPDGPFEAGDLSINQTAFLFGSSLTIASCFLLQAIAASRRQEGKLVAPILWGLSAFCSAILVLSTQSRAAFGLPWIAILVILAFCERDRLSGWINHLNNILFKDRRAYTKVVIFVVAIGAAVAALLLAMLLIYSNMDNMVSDTHRLYLLRCYFGGMFQGNNSFLYGLGFTRASQDVCRDIGLIRGTTHGHNLFAQVAADNGFVALVFLGLLVALLIRAGSKRIAFHANPVVLSSLCLSLYCFLFLLVEGGWGKISFLQALLGLAFASLTMQMPSDPSPPDPLPPDPLRPDPLRPDRLPADPLPLPADRSSVVLTPADQSA